MSIRMCFSSTNGLALFNITLGCVYYRFILLIIKNAIHTCAIKYFAMYCTKVTVSLKKIMI